MPFSAYMTGTFDVDASIKLAFDQTFIIASGQEANLDGFATVKRDIGAKSIQMTKYGRLPILTTPLNEKEDVTSVAMSDSVILLTPAEYGAAVTTTSLASLQTGGQLDLAVAQVVGENMGQTFDALFLAAVNGSANTNSGALSFTTANTLFTKLARQSVRRIGDAYVGIAHEDDLALLRADSKWVDVQKYASAVDILANEVGMCAGIRWVRNNLQTPGTVAAIGANAVGKAVSLDPSMTFTAGGDKLGRFVNVGWYGCLTYGLVDTDAVQILEV